MQPNSIIATTSLSLLGRVLTMRKQQCAQGLSSVRHNMSLLLKELEALQQQKSISIVDLPLEILQQQVGNFRGQLREISNLRQQLADLQAKEQQSLKELIGISAQEKVVEQLQWEAEKPRLNTDAGVATIELAPAVKADSFLIPTESAASVLSNVSTRAKSYFIDQGYIVALKMEEARCQLDIFLTKDQRRLELRIKISKQNDVELLMRVHDKTEVFTMTQRRELGQIFQGLSLRRVKFLTEFHDTSRAQPDFA